MLTFLALTFLGFVILVGGALFGHDHDHDGHFDHDQSHDSDGHSGEPTVSIFSMKVMGAFIMTFGAGGAIAYWNDYGWVYSSLIGIATGFSFGGIMYLLLRVMYSQQSNSLVSTEQAVGKTGIVSVEVGETSVGSVEIMLAGQSRDYLARSSAGVKIPKGSEVKVVRTSGSEVVVEAVS